MSTLRHMTWEGVLPRLDTETVHAAVTADPPTLCGLDVTELRVVLDLSHPQASEHRGAVNCQECLEWMHA